MPDPLITMTTRGFKNLDRVLKVESKRQKKALDTSVRVEGFRLMRLLKAEIRKGKPGGREFAPLSFIARRWGHRGRNSPLRRLAIAVRYFVAARDPLELQIGWVGPRVSERWRYFAKILQEGFERPVSEAQRKAMARSGGKMSGRSRNRQYFFLRRETKTFKTPPRPIMEPFWVAYRNETRRNITDNFRRKMRGERI